MLRVTVPTAGLRDDLGPLPDDVEVAVWALDGPAPHDRIDIVVLPYMGSKDLSALDGVAVGLVQSQSIGYDGLAERLPAGNVVANAAGVHETSTAELALALTLASQRRIDRYVRQAERHEWTRDFSPSLADRRVTLLGYGGVGKAIARRLDGFEVDLRIVASRARREDGRDIHALEDLAHLLPDSEILIAALPGGDDTRHIVDATVLAALPDDALVVNVGRGNLVDTDALVAELQAGRLRAALDVMDPEPLPADHPLWSAPGALIVPHVGGASDAMRPRIARLVRTQIDRRRAGDEPLNIVLRS